MEHLSPLPGTIAYDDDPFRPYAEFAMPTPLPPRQDDLPEWVSALCKTPGVLHLQASLRDPVLLPALAALGALHRRVQLHTDGVGLADDLYLRPFLPFDVQFAIHGTHVPEEEGEVDKTLKNLTAFGLPTSIHLHPDPQDPNHLVEEVRAMHARRPDHPIHLHGEGVEGGVPVPWPVLAEALGRLDALELSPPPWLLLHGVPPLALPVAAWEHLDLRVPHDVEAPQASPAYVAAHGEPTVDPDALSQGRVWMMTPPRERAGFRGRVPERVREATGRILVRPGQRTELWIEPLRDHTPYLLRGRHHGIAVWGTMNDKAVAQRFTALCRMVRERYPQDTLELHPLRDAAHQVRRSMGPWYDDYPPLLLQEGEVHPKKRKTAEASAS